MHLKFARMYNFSPLLGAAFRLDSVVDDGVAISVADKQSLSNVVRSVVLLGKLLAQALPRRRLDTAPDAVVEAVLPSLDASVVVEFCFSTLKLR